MHNRLTRSLLSSVVFAAEGDHAAGAPPATAPAGDPASPGPTEGSSPTAGPSSSSGADGAGSASTTAATSESKSGSPVASESTPGPDVTKAEPSLLAAAESKPAADVAKDTKPAAGDKPAGEAAAAAKDPKAAEAAAGEKKPEPTVAKDASKDAKPAADAAAGEKSEAKAEPGKEAAVEKPPARSYDAFKVPDGIKLEDGQVTAFTGILENGELDHQARAQSLVDLHIAEIKRAGDQLAQNQRDVWNTFQNRLKDEMRADEEVGGNRMDTALGIAKSVIEEFGGTDEQVAQTLARLSYTGMGNDVGLARVLFRAGQLLREGGYVSPSPPSAKTNVPRAEKWYGGGNGAG